MSVCYELSIIGPNFSFWELFIFFFINGYLVDAASMK